MYYSLIIILGTFYVSLIFLFLKFLSRNIETTVDHLSKKMVHIDIFSMNFGSMWGKTTGVLPCVRDLFNNFLLSNIPYFLKTFILNILYPFEKMAMKFKIEVLNRLLGRSKPRFFSFQEFPSGDISMKLKDDLQMIGYRCIFAPLIKKDLLSGLLGKGGTGIIIGTTDKVLKSSIITYKDFYFPCLVCKEITLVGVHLPFNWTKKEKDEFVQSVCELLHADSKNEVIFAGDFNMELSDEVLNVVTGAPVPTKKQRSKASPAIDHIASLVYGESLKSNPETMIVSSLPHDGSRISEFHDTDISGLTSQQWLAKHLWKAKIILATLFWYYCSLCWNSRNGSTYLALITCSEVVVRVIVHHQPRWMNNRSFVCIMFLIQIWKIPLVVGLMISILFFVEVYFSQEMMTDHAAIGAPLIKKRE